MSAGVSATDNRVRVQDGHNGAQSGVTPYLTECGHIVYAALYCYECHAEFAFVLFRAKDLRRKFVKEIAVGNTVMEIRTPRSVSNIEW